MFHYQTNDGVAHNTKLLTMGRLLSWVVDLISEEHTLAMYPFDSCHSGEMGAAPNRHTV